jgi:hypothetical protein
MNRIEEIFNDQMVDVELAKSRKHGVKVVIPVCSVLESEAENINSVLLPSSLVSFYGLYESMSFSWGISERHEESIIKFKNDPWIKDNYLDQEYDWSVVREMLSGHIDIQRIEDMFNPEYCKEQHFYSTLTSIGEDNPDDFIPFDIHWSITACLKKQDGKYLDNIWLVHADSKKMYDMGVTVEEYLNLAYQSKGLFNWPLTYLFKEKSKHYELMKRFLTRLVPHVELDLTSFGVGK